MKVFIMEKWIYKITNKINGKIYIGQSKNPKKRFQQHIKDEKVTSSIHNAIKKYGVENFTFEIIEGPISNHNEREIYWIDYYNSYSKGYNQTIGGDEPPIRKGEISSLSSYSNEKVLKIQLDLINTKLSFTTLSKIYEVDTQYLSLINRGIIRKNENFIYPLRPFDNMSKTEDELKEIANELLLTTKSVEQIAREYNMDSLTVYRLNLGKQVRCPKDIEYPIRRSGERLSQWLLNQIISDLLDNKLKLSDIQNKYNLSKATINRINQGKTYKRDNLIYPLRPSNKRVYN